MITTCGICGDRGIVCVNWADAPPDFAVCLCEAGLKLRVNRNWTHDVAPLWHLWCAREQIDQSRMLMLEDVLTPDELGMADLVGGASIETREAALLRAGKTRKPRL